MTVKRKNLLKKRQRLLERLGKPTCRQLSVAEKRIDYVLKRTYPAGLDEARFTEAELKMPINDASVEALQKRYPDWDLGIEFDQSDSHHIYLVIS